MTWLDGMHGRYVHGRRVRVLAAHLAPLLPEGAFVLDVGAGDGQISRAVMARRPDVEIIGIDPLVRPETQVPVRPFDGVTIPYPDRFFDVALFVDVLHHAADPLALLREGARVTRQMLLVKDHHRDGFLAEPILRFMDMVGNRRHGVSLPGNYLTSAEWRRAYLSLGLRADLEIRTLGLYPWPASIVFERGLHFIARLRPAGR